MHYTENSVSEMYRYFGYYGMVWNAPLGIPLRSSSRGARPSTIMDSFTTITRRGSAGTAHSKRRSISAIEIRKKTQKKEKEEENEERRKKKWSVGIKTHREWERCRWRRSRVASLCTAAATGPPSQTERYPLALWPLALCILRLIYRRYMRR